MSFSKETNTVTERNLLNLRERTEFEVCYPLAVWIFLHSQEIILIPYDIVTYLRVGIYESIIVRRVLLTSVSGAFLKILN
jgi:hypothetical protein